MRGKAITGAGGSHDEAREALKDEVQTHLINLKVNRNCFVLLKQYFERKENAGRREELERLDRQALPDLFIELARRDEESRRVWFRRVGRKGCKIELNYFIIHAHSSVWFKLSILQVHSASAG